MNEIIPADYAQIFDDLKTRICTTQVKAALVVNRERVLLYWSIRHTTLQQQEEHSWDANH